VASINGASSSYANANGLEPIATGWSGAGPSLATLNNIYNKYPIRKKQFEKYGMCTFLDSTKNSAPILSNTSWLSYCDCFAAQAMLLLDKSETLDKVITWIAATTYMGGSPGADFIQKLAQGKATIDYKLPDSMFWFSERNFSPDYTKPKSREDIGCGKLNLVNVAEPLKLARLMLGINDRYSDTVRIVPRLPESWSGIEANNWPVKTKNGVVYIKMTFEKKTKGKFSLRLEVKENNSIPSLVVRLPNGLRKEFKSVSGVLKM